MPKMPESPFIGRWKPTSRIVLLISGVVWSLLSLGTFLWNLSEQSQVTVEYARIIARTAIEKDILYRRWNSSHGGVYVPITEKTQPNPYLNGYPGHTIETLEGRQYTLINPAYMTRQVFELQTETLSVIGHITSLKPVRPENQADVWEVSALTEFEEGIGEMSTITVMEGKKVLRLMRPLYVEDKCLVCHAKQGYSLGEVRGGISQTVPLLPIEQANIAHRDALVLGHTGIWLSGLLGLTLAGWRIHRGLTMQAEAETKLVQMSTYDMLTGLYNRNYFEQTLENIQKERSSPVSILVGDIDGLKLVNDQYGHSNGDELIRKAADLLRESLRATDILARTGGDEFVAILPRADEEQAAQIVARIRENMRLFSAHGKGGVLQISLGVATTQANFSLNDTLKEADRRMYAEKADRRARQKPAG
jgi:diguanylate cyclase (GGDEF)-like protein